MTFVEKYADQALMMSEFKRSKASLENKLFFLLVFVQTWVSRMKGKKGWGLLGEYVRSSHYLKVSFSRHGCSSLHIQKCDMDYLTLMSTSSSSKIVNVSVFHYGKFVKTSLGIFCTGTTRIKQLRNKLIALVSIKTQIFSLFFVVISYPLVQTPFASLVTEQFEVDAQENGLTIETCILLFTCW